MCFTELILKIKITAPPRLKKGGKGARGDFKKNPESAGETKKCSALLI